MDSNYCSFCGHTLLAGSNICEGCGKIVPEPSIVSPNTNQPIQNSNSMFQNSPFQNQGVNFGNQTQQPANINDPRVKRNIVEFVNVRPKFFVFKELKEIFLAYLVIYIGFISRRLFFSEIKLLDAIFETVALIIGIFGAWLVLDKIVSYSYNLYPQFKFDSEKIMMSMLFSFIFIGFPPGYFKYKIWLKKLPKPNNIMKIQYISNLLLLIYGYIWYFLLTSFDLPSIFNYFPFIIAISVGIGILPIGNFRLILIWNRYLYFVLIALAIGLFVLSFPIFNPSSL